MERDKFYESKVLTDEEYNIDNLREAITGVMTKLYEKRSSTELVTESFTIINRIGDITVIDRDVDTTDEISIDDISSVDLLMDIVAEII